MATGITPLLLGLIAFTNELGFMSILTTCCSVPDLPRPIRGFSKLNRRRLSRQAGLMGVLLMIILAAGCAGERTNLVEGVSKAKEDGKVVAILRNNVEADLLAQASEHTYRILLASMDRGEKMKWIDSISLKEPTTKDGWLYLPLSPGTYFLYLLDNHNFQHTSYWFQLAKDVSATYIGTLTHACPGTGNLDCVQVIDQHEQLQNELASTGLGRATTSLLRPYAASPFGLSKKDSVGLVVIPGLMSRTPDWQKRAIRRAIIFGGDEDGEDPVAKALAMDAELLMGGGSPYVVILSAPVGVLHLVYLPFGYAVGKVVGNSTEKKRQPCMKAFTERTKRLDVTQLFRGAANQWAEAHPGTTIVTANPTGGFEKEIPDVLLEFGSLSARLRECGSANSFCIELTCLVKVFERSNLTQARFYMYSYKERKTLGGYEVIVDQKSTAHEIEDYCGSADGIDQMIAEIEKGIRAVMEAALLDFYGVPRSNVEEKSVPPSP